MQRFRNWFGTRPTAWPASGPFCGATSQTPHWNSLQPPGPPPTTWTTTTQNGRIIINLYASANPTIAAKLESEERLERLEEMEQFGVHYIDLSDLRGDTTITFAGDTAVDLIDAPPRSGEQVWYAPGIDDLNAQLTATFDLTDVNEATLKYAVWYDPGR